VAARPKCAAAFHRLTMHDPAALRIALGSIYAVGAILAGLASRDAVGRQRTFWLLTALLLALLMAAKELHLIDELTGSARGVVKLIGWYGIHREVQRGLLIALSAVALVLAALLARWLRGSTAMVKLAAAALLFLLGLLIARAISLHAVDKWMMAAVAGMRRGWWLEAVAVLAICAAAWSAMDRRRAFSR